VEIMQNEKRVFEAPLSERVSAKAREKLLTLDHATLDMYRLETCQICREHLTIEQLNKVIIKGDLPLCPKHHKEVKTQLEQLAPMLGQLRLL